jgi:hypothetical protein
MARMPQQNNFATLNMVKNIFVIPMCVILAGCSTAVKDNQPKEEIMEGSFASDVAFLKQFTEVVVLQEPSGKAKIALSPALQGRVMTSTSNGEAGKSYGWINRDLFSSRDTLEHMNAFGGEERLWLGPEGGQFSIFFEKGKEFSFDDWVTPKLIDLEPFELISKTENTAVFSKSAEIKNYSGTTFRIKIHRAVKILNAEEAFHELGMDTQDGIDYVAYQSSNTLQNSGSDDWDKQTGILSIWMLGMFNPSDELTIVVPYNQGSDRELGPIVNDDYFGKVPSDRLKVGDGVIYFKGDGKYRSKIGLTPLRAKNVIGSYDEENKTLTILKFNKPDGEQDYVNSKWEIQEHPFKGDVINSYNDGPAKPGAKPMGPFYELESSSPAKELKSGQSVVHIQTTFHFRGDDEAIGHLSQAVFGVSTAQIKQAFKKD